MMKLPINWPINFQYSPISVSVDVSIVLMRRLLSLAKAEDKEKISPWIEQECVHPDIRIEKITCNLTYKGPRPHPLADSEIFPGHVQHGVFALRKIPKGTQLGEYVGEIAFDTKSLTPTERFKGVHRWEVQFGGLALYISSAHIANELAFVNDYHGLQPQPNVRPTWIEHRGQGYLGYETLRDIEPLEEILTDYGDPRADYLLKDR